MNIEGDFMELGSLVPLENGWFLDKDTNTKFRLDDQGNAVGEDGEYLHSHEDEDY